MPNNNQFNKLPFEQWSMNSTVNTNIKKDVHVNVFGVQCNGLAVNYLINFEDPFIPRAEANL